MLDTVTFPTGPGAGRTASAPYPQDADRVTGNASGRAEDVVADKEDTPELIAIVDDDASVRRALSRLMRACGLSVETYESAEEFLESPSAVSVSCLLLDLHMNGMSGTALLKLLGDAGAPPPTIVITAHANEPAFERLHRSGLTILRKPVESETLVGAVGHAIGRDLHWSE
jgi:FixJ family two-component response regulator